MLRDAAQSLPLSKGGDFDAKVGRREAVEPLTVQRPREGGGSHLCPLREEGDPTGAGLTTCWDPLWPSDQLFEGRGRRVGARMLAAAAQLGGLRSFPALGCSR